MASAAQIQANRSNARKSTGPHTAAGKEKASRNAVKHGLLAQEAVIAGEDPEEFELYRERMLAELAPAGAVEAMLAERVVGLSWRLRRAERLQNAAFAALDGGEPTPLLDARHEEWKQLKGSEWDRGVAGVIDENAALGQVVVADFAEARVLDRLLMYERRIESSLYRTMAELRNERQARAAAATPEKVSRSQGHPAVGQEAVAPAKLASFGANSMPQGAAKVEGTGSVEGASSVKRQVSSDGSDFTSETSHFKGMKITPYGVTTNAITPYGVATNAVPDVPAEGQSCETNPISGGVSRWKRQRTNEESEGSGDIRQPSPGHTQIAIRPGKMI